MPCVEAGLGPHQETPREEKLCLQTVPWHPTFQYSGCPPNVPPSDDLGLLLSYV